jgi:hypothetical protein
MAKIVIQKQTAPATPDIGDAAIFVDSADNKLKVKQENGVVDNIPTENSLVSKMDALYFWDWSDGDVVIATTITLARDMYYNNLTITSPWILNPNGYRIYIKWTLSGNGKIQRNGNDWVNWSGWASLNTWTLNADVGWSNWWAWNWYWSTWLNPSWVAWVSTNPSYTNITSAKWGNGWTSTWPWAPWAWSGWAVWTSTRWVYYNVWWNPFNWLFRACWPASFVIPSFTQYKVTAWAAWGGGWSAWQYQGYGGWGGWGGWNGWLIWAAINIVNRTGTWESKWGKWGNGWSVDPTYQTTSSVWWGGGGWSGWVIYLLYRSLTSMWTETLTGWLKWTPWTVGVQPTIFAEDWPAGASIKIPV